MSIPTASIIARDVDLSSFEADRINPLSLKGREFLVIPFNPCYNICYYMEVGMASTKIRKVGNSLGVVLPKTVLNRLNVSDGDQLYLSEAPDGAMRITPYDPEFEEQMQAAKEGMKTYRNTLRELSK